MLLDSNIIIYSTQPEYSQLRQFMAQHAVVVSAVSYVEVLGYHRLSEADKRLLTSLFKASTVLPISQLVLDEAVQLRQVRKMALGDALIAATALVHNMTLVTHNTKDFDWIANLKVLDPLAEQR